MNTLLKASLGILLANSLQAAVYTYEGVDNGAWTTPANWSADGQTAATAPGTNDQIIINDKSVIWSTGKANYRNYKNINVSGSGQLTIRTSDTSDVQLGGSTFNINSKNGLVIAQEMWARKNDGLQSNITFNLQNQGSVNFSKLSIATGSGSTESQRKLSTFNNWNITGTLDISGFNNIRIETRELVTFDAFTGDATSTWDFTSFNPTGADSFYGMKASFTSDMLTTTMLGYNFDMTTLGLTDSDLGKYSVSFVYNNENDKTKGGKWVVNYVTGDAIPEPATASLSLLALGALALRRRRKN